jgi:hypothetical protein
VVWRNLSIGFTAVCSAQRYAIYGSLEPGLAADEAFNFLLRHFGWQSRDVPPRMLVGIRVSLRAVLDLTNLKSVLTHLILRKGYSCPLTFETEGTW